MVISAAEAVVHVVNPIDEYTGSIISGGGVYIGTTGLNPPFTYIGSVPTDIWFGEGHPYDFGNPYTIVVKKDGYIFAADMLTLNAGDEITTEGALLSCAIGGCGLLKHYDSNNGGYHSMDDTLNAIRDWHDGHITLTENLAVIKSWAGDGINYLCPGCWEATHEPPAPSSTNFYIIMAIMAAAAAFIIIRNFKK